jgi:hypothetical protein
MTKPDGISVGMIDKLGLKDYSVNGSLTHFKVPQKTVAGYAKELKKKFDLESIRFIGNPEMKFTKIAFMAGAPGGQRHIQMLKIPDVEVIIAGEAPEWETYLYTNDAVAQGKNKAVIFWGTLNRRKQEWNIVLNGWELLFQVYLSILLKTNPILSLSKIG